MPSNFIRQTLNFLKSLQNGQMVKWTPIKKEDLVSLAPIGTINLPLSVCACICFCFCFFKRSWNLKFGIKLLDENSKREYGEVGLHEKNLVLGLRAKFQ